MKTQSCTSVLSACLHPLCCLSPVRLASMAHSRGRFMCTCMCSCWPSTKIKWNQLWRDDEACQVSVSSLCVVGWCFDKMHAILKCSWATLCVCGKLCFLVLIWDNQVLIRLNWQLCWHADLQGFLSLFKTEVTRVRLFKIYLFGHRCSFLKG